ncbi:hypothetical protein QA648_10910 [Rhizobium sp. CB3171]|uniref:hypothetical protein n=1 Tax=Rhizobium sp. CB3171 TaxID=3039157 RepID=UPI0024B05D39|nr:hypothetical protein [Rhizobium sp. CB3171]WFU00681.1 hypothetical protein QA648_10910 [Rhizobium sp. CB3171]
MSKLGYVVEGDENDERPTIQVVVVRSYDSAISCGPVPVMDFAEHRSRVAHLDADDTHTPPSGIWFVVYRLADIPDGYVMLWDGTNYIVVDEIGNRIAGPGSDPIDVANDAWTYYKTKYGR